jgi:long-subunit acyl-CoA synthetase (AMP-forming)
MSGVVSLLDLLRERARFAADHVALDDLQGRRIRYGALPAAVRSVADRLAALEPGPSRVLGLHGGNGIDWVLVDLAALELGLAVVPLPTFFSAEQLAHAISESGAGIVLTDDPDSLCPALGRGVLARRVGGLRVIRLGRYAGRATERAAKITFTSGTTGAPRGVALGAAALVRVARSVAEAASTRPHDRHLCLLPLSILLENVGGVYRSLCAGATVLVPPLATVGMHGATRFDGERAWRALASSGATSGILMPAMLDALIAHAPASGVHASPAAAGFFGVGGAPVSERALHRAAEIGLPVFEGYGLTEAGSVVALNRRDANRVGSVGRPLRHVALRVAADGEVVVHGTGDGATAGLRTGDLGRVDDDGFLFVVGRAKNAFITTHGRNVSPEWLERRLTAFPGITQAAAFGDGRSQPAAVLVTRLPRAAVAACIRRLNTTLPDYACIERFALSAEPFRAENGLLTAKGDPDRRAIESRFAMELATELATRIPTS